MVGLILNELITNTFKYAFKTYNKNNLLQISCKIELDTIILKIEDNGVGYKKEDIKQDSLGLDMVTEMVYQLNGTITTESSNAVVNTIKIPCTS